MKYCHKCGLIHEGPCPVPKYWIDYWARFPPMAKEMPTMAFLKKYYGKKKNGKKPEKMTPAVRRALGE